jgi:hypothetical protein
MAYQYAATHSGGLSNRDVHIAALAMGAIFVDHALPTVGTDLRLDHLAIIERVSAHLGRLMALDPCISAGVPLSVPSPQEVSARIPSLLPNPKPPPPST